MNQRVKIQGKGFVELHKGHTQNLVVWMFQGTSKGEVTFKDYNKALDFYRKMERFLIYEQGGISRANKTMAV